MILYWYVLWNDYHKKFSLHSSPHIVIKSFFLRVFIIYSLTKFQIYNRVLTIVTILYTTSPGLIYFIMEVCTIWTPLPIFPTQYSLLLAPANLFSVSMSWILFFGFLDSTYKWDPKVFVSLFYVKCKKSSPRPIPRNILFSSKGFMISDLIFKCLIHWVNFVYSVRFCGPVSSFCMWLYSLPNTIEKTVFSP